MNIIKLTCKKFFFYVSFSVAYTSLEPHVRNPSYLDLCITGPRVGFLFINNQLQSSSTFGPEVKSRTSLYDGQAVALRMATAPLIQIMQKDGPLSCKVRHI